LPFLFDSPLRILSISLTFASFNPKIDSRNTHLLLNKLPERLQTTIDDPLGKDLNVVVTKLRDSIADIVKQNSRSQSLKGIITAGPVNSVVYAFSKIQKALSSRK